MRRKNPRVILAGSALLVLVIAFFLVMMAMAPRSNDPIELLRVVGTVSGVVGGLAVAMIVGGAVGKKA